MSAVKLPAAFRLASGVRLVISKGDLTRWNGDAIVNAANERMLGGGGVDGAIHRAAGPQLVKACEAVAEVRPGVRCPTGEARITPGFNLPAKFVIHTVGPIYANAQKSAPLLSSSYRNSLLIAKKQGNIASIAFPAISCGVFGYPLEEAAEVALTTCREVTQQGQGDGEKQAQGDASTEGQALNHIEFVLFSNDAVTAWVTQAEKMFEKL